jgi:hypothetical protein
MTTSYRAFIQLYVPSNVEGGPNLRENDTTVMFTADSDEAARAELHAQTRACLLKKGQPKDVHYHSHLYVGAELLYELNGSSLEDLTAEAFFASEPVPYDQHTNLFNKMQSGGPGHVVEKKS